VGKKQKRERDAAKPKRTIPVRGRKKAEKAIERSQLSLEAVVETVRDLIVLHDQDDRILLFNRACEELTGYKREEVIGRKVSELFLPPEWIPVAKKWFADPYALCPHENPWITKSGQERLIEWRCTAFPTPEGGRPQVLCTGIDITDRKRAEEQAWKLTQFLNLAIDSANVWLNVLDEKGNVLIWNRAAEGISGYSREEVIGRAKIWEWLYPDEKYRREVTDKAALIIRGGVTDVEDETIIRTKSGEHKVISWHSRNIVNEKGASIGSVALGRDITKHKKMQEQIESLARFPSENPNPVLRLSQDGIVLYANEATDPLLQDYCKVGSVAPKFWRDMATEALASQSSKSVDIEIGEQVYSFFVAPVKEAGYVNLYGTDITERKRMEEILRRSEQEKTAILENMSELVAYLDTENRILWGNRAVTESFGLDLQQMIGRRCYEVWHQRKIPCIDCPANEALKTGQHQEWEFTTPDGRVWLTRGDPVRDAKGEVVGIIEVSEEITERRKMEEALRQSEEKFRRIATNIEDVLYSVDGETGEFRYLSPAFERLLGYTPEDIRQMGGRRAFLSKVIQGARFAEQDRRFERLKSQRGVRDMPDRYETWWLCKDGSLKCLEDRWIPVYEGERMVSTDGVLRDITERRHIEEALQESEEKYRAIVENSPNLITIYQDGGLKYVNRAFCERLGWTFEEMTSPSFDPLDKIVPETFLAFAKEKLSRRLRGELLPSYEISLLTRDGSEIPILVYGQRILYHGKPAILGIFVDITELKRLEDELRRYSQQLEELVENRTKDLRESEERFRTSIENMLDCFGIYQAIRDESGRIIDFRVEYVNAAACASNLMSKEEQIGKRLLELLPAHRETGLFDDYCQLVETGEPLMKDALIYEDVYGKRRLRRAFDVRAVKLGDGFAAAWRDVTEHRRIEQALLRSERLAAIGEAAAMVGHDLRNPLQAMVNMLYLGRKRLESIPPQLRELAEKYGILELMESVGDQIEYMDKIVSDLQDYAKEVKPKLVETSISGLIDDTLSTTSVPGNVQISVVVEKGLPKLMVDPALMKRVFTNLVINALEAMPDGGRLKIEASVKREEALIDFHDTGVGIAEEDLDKMFQPLFTTRAKGMGLGLVVAKRLVEAHGGDVMVHSKVGEGSIFTVKLPLRKK